MRMFDIFIKDVAMNGKKLDDEKHIMNELKKGRKSGEENGWLTDDEGREHFRDKTIE